MVEEFRSHFTYFSSFLFCFFDNVCSHCISVDCLRECSSRSLSEILLIFTSSSSTQNGFLYSELRYFVFKPNSPTFYRKWKGHSHYYFHNWKVIFTFAWNVIDHRKQNNAIKKFMKMSSHMTIENESMTASPQTHNFITSIFHIDILNACIQQWNGFKFNLDVEVSVTYVRNKSWKNSAMKSTSWLTHYNTADVSKLYFVKNK